MSSKSLGKNTYTYMPSHPLYTTHATKFDPNNLKTVPNIIGPPLPQRDQGDCKNITALQCLHFLSLGVLEMT